MPLPMARPESVACFCNMDHGAMKTRPLPLRSRAVAARFRAFRTAYAPPCLPAWPPTPSGGCAAAAVGAHVLGGRGDEKRRWEELWQRERADRSRTPDGGWIACRVLARKRRRCRSPVSGSWQGCACRRQVPMMAGRDHEANRFADIKSCLCLEHVPQP